MEESDGFDPDRQPPFATIYCRVVGGHGDSRLLKRAKRHELRATQSHPVLEPIQELSHPFSAADWASLLAAEYFRSWLFVCGHNAQECGGGYNN